jgi:transposase
VEQALEPGASVAGVARAYGLNANVVFSWRRLYSEGKLALEAARAIKLLPVSIEEREVVEPPPEEGIIPSCASIHSELPGYVRISVERNADPAAIRAVLRSCYGDRFSCEGARRGHADLDRGRCDGHAIRLSRSCVPSLDRACAPALFRPHLHLSRAAWKHGEAALVRRRCAMSIPEEAQAGTCSPGRNRLQI